LQLLLLLPPPSPLSPLLLLLLLLLLLQGANQAVAAVRLMAAAGSHEGQEGHKVRFVCRFGNDSFADMLQQQLAASGVDISGCSRVTDMTSGGLH
jgi:sugar/nucleoside kinase (ribokinase family)